MKKQSILLVLMVICVVVSSCGGGSSTPSDITGRWFSGLAHYEMYFDIMQSGTDLDTVLTMLDGSRQASGHYTGTINGSHVHLERMDSSSRAEFNLTAVDEDTLSGTMTASNSSVSGLTLEVTFRKI